MFITRHAKERALERRIFMFPRLARAFGKRQGGQNRAYLFLGVMYFFSHDEKALKTVFKAGEK